MLPKASAGLALLLASIPTLFLLGWTLGRALADWSDSATATGIVNAISAPDADSDGLPDDIDPDDDNDRWSDVAETTIGTNPLLACGPDAWPPDINNNGFVDITGDIVTVANHFGESVPPAAARYDIAPDPPDGFIDVIGDIVRLAGLFGAGCGP